MNAFLTLIRRELWEHRGLVWAPLLTAALLVVVTFFGSRVGGVDINFDDDESIFFADLAENPAAQIQLFAVWTSSLMVPQLLVALLVIFFYLLDALYSERKDRSILFWKSLPVSDAATVGAKFMVAAFLMPIWVWALSLVSGLLIFLIVKVIVAATHLAPLGLRRGFEIAPERHVGGRGQVWRHHLVIGVGQCLGRPRLGGFEPRQRAGLVDHIIVVTRWYGGKHLGGDRFRHVQDCVTAYLANLAG